MTFSSRFSLVSSLAIGLITFAGCSQSTTTGPKGSGSTNPPSNAKRLTVSTAKEQTIHRGKTDNVSVSINRDNFNDAVTVKVSGLPKGIEANESEATIPSGSNSVTLTLKAASDAPLGEHLVTLTAEAPSVDKNVQTFKVNVKE